MTVYIAVTYILFGQLPSISQSYYEFEKKYKKYNGKNIFSLVLLLYAFSIMYEGLNISQGSPFQFLMFIAPAGVLFTASAPQFKESLTNKVHFIGAGIGVIFGLLAIILIFNLTLIFALITALLLYLAMIPIKNKIFWIEVSAIYTIHMVLIYIKYCT